MKILPAGLTFRHMLHRQVMVIARFRAEGTWKAYCFPVPGVNHNEEEYLWRDNGTQLPEKVARPMFPMLEEYEYANQ